MLLLRPNRLARWAGAIVLALPGLAAAQDGQPPAGTPVTNPKTNELKPREQTSTPPPQNSNEALPGVPATPSDPAPVGTRAVPANSAVAPTGLPPADARAAGRIPDDSLVVTPGAASLTAPGIHVVEGIVTGISRPSKDAPGELIRLTLDPTRTWNDYVRGSYRVTRREAARPATYPDRARDDARIARDKQRIARDKADGADEATLSGDRAKLAVDRTRAAENANRRAEADANAKAGRKPLELAFTRNTRMFTFARTLDGIDLYGAATASSPNHLSSRSGLTRQPLPAASGATSVAPGPQETNFTNIREGSFLAVRYRRVGDVNELLNVSLIEPPVLDPNTMPPGVTPATTRGAPPAAGTAVPPGVPPVGGVPGRTPRVPNQPVGAQLPH
jgi:hypothetical protein